MALNHNVPASVNLPSGKIIEKVEDFKYLGATIMSSLTEFNIRRGIAWSSFWKLISIWKSKQLSIELKMKLFDSLVVSILLYGAETWSITPTMEARLNSFATSCYRIILGIKRLDRIRNTIVLDRVKRKNFAKYVFKRQLTTLGHWIRRGQDSLIGRLALYTPTNGRNRRGRPRITYNKQIQRITDAGLQEIKELALNRNGWRSWVVERLDLHPPAG